MNEVMTPAIISVEQLHEFRKEIDACIVKAKGFKNSYFIDGGSTKGQRENSIVLTKLQEAKMWVGKVIEEVEVDSKFPKELRDTSIVNG